MGGLQVPNIILLSDRTYSHPRSIAVRQTITSTSLLFQIAPNAEELIDSGAPPDFASPSTRLCQTDENRQDAGVLLVTSLAASFLLDILDQLRQQRDLGLEATTLHEGLVTEHQQEKEENRRLRDQLRVSRENTHSIAGGYERTKTFQDPQVLMVSILTGQNGSVRSTTSFR